MQLSTRQSAQLGKDVVVLVLLARQKRRLRDQAAGFLMIEGLAATAVLGSKSLGLGGYHKDHPCLYRNGFPKQQDGLKSHKQLPSCRKRAGKAGHALTIGSKS